MGTVDVSEAPPFDSRFPLDDTDSRTSASHGTAHLVGRLEALAPIG